ncbi:MAG: hypothetical protein NTV61_10810 [Candidatus Bathyarchaeota archaeon]|nr:hypothetical protein [Candidatus Bathyarchaeota archaeon]
MKRYAIVYDKGIAGYDFGEEYALRGDRFLRYLRLLEQLDIFKRPDLILVKPKAVDDSDLMLVHTREYIDRVNQVAENMGFSQMTRISSQRSLKP